MSKKKEHGISEALYVGGPGEPYYKPFIACLCGWHTENGSPRTWEEAGAELDEHLASVEQKESSVRERRRQKRQSAKAVQP